MADDRGRRVTLVPGTVLRHRSGTCAVLDRRKDDGSGWWLLDRGGLADDAIASGDWFYVAESVSSLAANYERTVLADIASRNPGIDLNQVSFEREETARKILTGGD